MIHQPEIEKILREKGLFQTDGWDKGWSKIFSVDGLPEWHPRKTKYRYVFASDTSGWLSWDGVPLTEEGLEEIANRLTEGAYFIHRVK